MEKKLSQKLYPPEQLREKVTIRVLPEKLQVYPRFKELVTQQLGSDICFVTTSLWEAFITAMDQIPPNQDPVEIKFMRQNVQINIGCNFNYTPKKARRNPASREGTEIKKNYLLPGILDQWSTLGDPQKEYWRKQFIAQGIIQDPFFKKPRKTRSDKGKPRKKRAPPSISTGARAKAILKKIFKAWSRV